MRRRRTLWMLAGACAAVGGLLAAQLPAATADAPASGLSIYRVPAPDEAATQRLIDAGFDVLEKREGDDMFVLGEAATDAQLRAAGFTPRSSEALAPKLWKAPTTMVKPGVQPLADPINETYNGGYHTVRAHYAHLAKVAADYPNLAKVINYGVSHLKSKNSDTGYDLKAICITVKTPGTQCGLTPTEPRPRFLFMAQMHAREIVTGDMAWRFIDQLTNGYEAGDSTNPITKLLKTTEVWVIPIVNPDGVDLVQQGGNSPYLQRKNRNGTGCANPVTSTNQPGVDLNRNSSWQWGGASTSTDKCSVQHHGAAANSEVETTALQGLITELFPDQRSSGEAAPATAKGTMLTMHSFAGTVLYPWNYKNDGDSPNDAGLRAIAKKIGQLTAYDYGRAGDLLKYNASGTIDDWTYGRLGVASFTIEMGSCGSFIPDYTCTDTEYYTISASLIYLAQKAKAPYAP